MRLKIVAYALAGLIGSTSAAKPKPRAADPNIESSRLVDEKPQVGVASWYGAQFQGDKTASGEPFDENSLTAAHRTLPLGTKVKVTNLNNHKQVILRITDRGPFIGRRLIDVSRAAAKRLGFIHSGTAPVRVEALATSH